MKRLKILVVLVLSLPLTISSPVLAATAGISQVQSFLQSIITAIAGLAGMVATGFFVLGGLSYITSSGNPKNLERAKRTIFFSAAGLAITIAAFVLSNIISGLATNAFGS